MADLTDADLDRLEVLCQAATPGPWIRTRRLTHGYELVERVYLQDSDRHFGGAARDVLPRLLAEVRRWRARDATVRAALERLAYVQRHWDADKNPLPLACTGHVHEWPNEYDASLVDAIRLVEPDYDA